MRVLGVDPSVKATGLAWRNLSNGIATRTIARPSVGVGVDHWVKRARRRRSISTEIVGIALAIDADLVAIEGPYVARQSPDEIDKLALHGVIHDDLIAARIPFVVIPPTSLKYFGTGKNASKDDMVAAAQARGMEGKDNNQADGMFCMFAGEAGTGTCPIEWSDLALSYLDGAEWPSSITVIEFPVRPKKSKTRKAAA